MSDWCPENDFAWQREVAYREVNFTSLLEENKKLKKKLDDCKQTVRLAEKFAKEQLMPESQICMSALKDIRRKLNEPI